MGRISSFFSHLSPISSSQNASSRNKPEFKIPTLDPSIQASLKQQNMAMRVTNCGNCAGDACGVSLKFLESLVKSEAVDQSSLDEILTEMSLSESDSTKEVSESSTGNKSKTFNRTRFSYRWFFSCG